jgi:hypothetical protein
MVASPSLLALARAEMRRAKHWRIGRTCAHVVTLLLALAGLIVSSETATYLLAATAVASEGTAWTMRYLAKVHHHRGERGLRAAEQRKHLDPAAAVGIDAEVAASVSGWARKHAARFEDPAYWQIDDPPSAATLQNALDESSFWSWHLYLSASRWAAGVAAVVLGVAVALLLVLVLADADGAAQTTARVIGTLVAFVIGADVLTAALDWRRAGLDARDVRRSFMGAPLSTADVLGTYTDLRVTTGSVEPIPDALWRRHHDRLTEAYARDRGQPAA